MFDLHTNNEVVSLPACYTQTFFIYIYVSAEISILTVMAHDRYIAINFPLHYVTIISSRRVKLLIFGSWMYSITVMSVGISLVARLPLCGYEINRVYCSSWEIVKLSCIDTNTNNIYGFLIICSHCLPLIFIIYSYIKILRVCWNNSKSHKFKAFQTCVPHLVTLLFFTSSVLFEVIESRLNLKRALNTLTLFASLEFLTLPPLVNPLVYGIILPEIRKKIVYVVFCKEGKMSVH
ncbi:olfactory receptor 51G2-like [Polypterus senegalus]|uniref:olfactory receptor 51G2-like n=1 Tax=Polypterus senegalus TaxID=55291 RepID=UPI0019623447|nr:olfactory receptor 51G2-like [Polypterus senegalus]